MRMCTKKEKAMIPMKTFRAVQNFIKTNPSIVGNKQFFVPESLKHNGMRVLLVSMGSCIWPTVL